MSDASDCLSSRRVFAIFGESGSGKTELAVNLAIELAKTQNVHFFDLDQTKPLYRARDLARLLCGSGVSLHYERQYLDAPVSAGGVADCLSSPRLSTVLDIGGGENGARLVGQYAAYLSRPYSKIIYLLNPYRPWSQTISSIDRTLAEILAASHLQLSQVSFWASPNLGAETSAEDVLEGMKMLGSMTGPYIDIECAVIKEDLRAEVESRISVPVLPVRINFNYE